MFTIKICGITRPEDARATVQAGADAIGLNFYANSPRAIDIVRARSIIAELPREVLRVGLFVNSPPDEISRTYDTLGLDLIQLHGDEPPELLAALGKRPVMKAFRAKGKHGLQSVFAFLESCRALDCLPNLIVLDAPLTSKFGGSGKLADWRLAREYNEYNRNEKSPLLVLAGGLNADNVAEAIRATGARAVDTASGVESRPGIKDAAAIAAFVLAARSAWAAQG
jgi:phosphoribosylanthranilate isomerase